jgi:tetratricopeptide (TPR) repeat protein
MAGIVPAILAALLAGQADAAEAEAAPTPTTAIKLDIDTLAAKVARYPDNPYLLNEYGNQLLRKGRLDEAVQAYSEAVDLNPEFVQAWNNLGLAYQAQRRFNRARRAYGEALDLAPNLAIVHYNLGTAYEALGNYQKMIRSYQRAIELDRDLATLEHNPQLAANRHLSAVLLQIYVDRGGSVYHPVLSAYPKGP